MIEYVENTLTNTPAEFRAAFLEMQNYVINKIRTECVVRPDEPMFGKLPGSRYKGQYYLGNATISDSKFLHAVTGIFLESLHATFQKAFEDNKVKGTDFHFQIAGREWSSLPIISAISMNTYLAVGEGVNSFMVRRKRKTYGKHNLIEGVPNNLPVILVDDICNSTNSFKQMHDVCVAEGLTVLPFVFAILNKKSAKKHPEEHKYDKYLKTHRCITVCNVDDLE